MSLKRTKSLAALLGCSVLVVSLLAPTLTALETLDPAQGSELPEARTELSWSFSGWISSLLDWLTGFAGAATAEVCTDCGSGTTDPGGESTTSGEGSTESTSGGDGGDGGDGEVGGQLDPFG